MHKILKILALADLAMLSVTIIVYLLANGSENIILAFFPLTATIFLTVAILVVGFLIGVQQAIVPRHTGTTGFVRAACLLLVIPLLGLYYAAHGQNRHSLVLVSGAGLAIGSVATLVLLAKRLKRKP